MLALDVKDVDKSFRQHFWSPKKQILKKISFSVEDGEIFGLLGPNGAGKSTLIKIINRILFPDKGTVRIFEASHFSQSYSAAIGYMPEQPHFYDYLTGREFLRYMGSLFGISSKQLKERTDRLLQLVGMATRADFALRKYSKGMLQRIGIAQALINDPKLVILDEPMSGLDPIGRKEVRDIIFHLKSEGKTIFFSTHILQDVEMICDHVAILNEGSLIKIGRLTELLRKTTTSVDLSITIPDDQFISLSKKLPHMQAIQSGDHRILTFIPIRDEAEDAFYTRLNESIKQIATHKGTVYSVTPKKETLEDIFMREIAERTSP